jgi:hypothetical protein
VELSDEMCAFGPVSVNSGFIPCEYVFLLVVVECIMLYYLLKQFMLMIWTGKPGLPPGSKLAKALPCVDDPHEALVAISMAGASLKPNLHQACPSLRGRP